MGGHELKMELSVLARDIIDMDDEDHQEGTHGHPRQRPQAEAAASQESNP